MGRYLLALVWTVFTVVFALSQIFNTNTLEPTVVIGSVEYRHAIGDVLLILVGGIFVLYYIVRGNQCANQ